MKPIIFEEELNNLFSKHKIKSVKFYQDEVIFMFQEGGMVTFRRFGEIVDDADNENAVFDLVENATFLKELGYVE